MRLQQNHRVEREQQGWIYHRAQRLRRFRIVLNGELGAEFAASASLELGRRELFAKIASFS
jgi:hypothetical protein